MFYSGERRGERNCEVVQCDQGLRIHPARRRWKQRRIRAHLGGGKSGLQFTGRGCEGILRCCPEPRQGIGRKSAGELGVGFALSRPSSVFSCCACRKSNPNIFVVQSAEDWTAKNTPCPLHGAR